MLLPER